MTRLQIREAVVDDLPSILTLYAQPGYDDGDKAPLRMAQMIFEKARAYPFYKFFVADDGDVIVGTYSILVMDNIVIVGRHPRWWSQWLSIQQNMVRALAGDDGPCDGACRRNGLLQTRPFIKHQENWRARLLRAAGLSPLRLQFCRRSPSGQIIMYAQPILSGRGLTKKYGARLGCCDVDVDLFPAEVLAIVGESGSGKSTLLGLLSTHLPKSAGSLEYTRADGVTLDLDSLSEMERRLLLRTEWGFVQQDARMGPAHECLRWRKCWRTTHGGRMASLRGNSPGGAGLAGACRNRC